MPGRRPTAAGTARTSATRACRREDSRQSRDRVADNRRGRPVRCEPSRDSNTCAVILLPSSAASCPSCGEPGLAHGRTPSHVRSKMRCLREPGRWRWSSRSMRSCGCVTRPWRLLVDGRTIEAGRLWTTSSSASRRSLDSSCSPRSPPPLATPMRTRGWPRGNSMPAPRQPARTGCPVNVPSESASQASEKSAGDRCRACSQKRRASVTSIASTRWTTTCRASTSGSPAAQMRRRQRWSACICSCSKRRSVPRWQPGTRFDWGTRCWSAAPSRCSPRSGTSTAAGPSLDWRARTSGRCSTEPGKRTQRSRALRSPSGVVLDRSIGRRGYAMPGTGALRPRRRGHRRAGARGRWRRRSDGLQAPVLVGRRPGLLLRALDESGVRWCA